MQLSLTSPAPALLSLTQPAPDPLPHQVLLTSMNWLFLSDPATFKPASLPQVASVRTPIVRCSHALSYSHNE